MPVEMSRSGCRHGSTLHVVSRSQRHLGGEDARWDRGLEYWAIVQESEQVVASWACLMAETGIETDLHGVVGGLKSGMFRWNGNGWNSHGGLKQRLKALDRYLNLEYSGRYIMICRWRVFRRKAQLRP